MEARVAKEAQEFSLREAELRLSLLRAEVEANSASSAPPSVKPASVRLPTFTEGDDMSSFLCRFEKIARLLAIPENSQAVHLASVLTGKALQIYASLPASVTDDYTSLKRELLRGFNKNPDTYRQVFRNMRVDPAETMTQFVARLRGCLELWVESVECPHSFEGLLEFFFV